MSLLSKSSRFIGRGGVCRRIIGEKSWVPFSQDHLQCSTFHQKRWLCSNLGEEKNESNSSTSELKERLKNRIEERKLSKWKPGQKLTNAEILSLFRSYSERNSSQDAEGVKKAFQHPILHVYGFDRKEFIQGVKQALSMISESVSSPRFRAFCKGATRSCEESDFLQSVTSPEVFESFKALTDASKYSKDVQDHFLTRFFIKMTQLELPTYKITHQLFTFRRLESIALSMEAEPVQGKSFGDIESKLETIEEVENEDNSHNEKSVKAEQLINALSEMNPDDFNFRVSMTICVRCQLATTIQLDVDEEMSKEWTTRTEDEWMFLYFQSYLDDFDWKIAKCATETEYEETPYLLSPDVK